VGPKIQKLKEAETNDVQDAFHGVTLKKDEQRAAFIGEKTTLFDSI